MIVFEVLYIIFCLILARINYQIIGQGKKPNHWLNGIVHCIVAAGSYFIFWKPAAIIILLNARVFFDATLNYLRFGRINYVSIKPESWMDRIEKFLFGMDGYTPKIMWLSISFLLNAIYYLFIF